MISSGIENIIFDLGGVILHLDTSRSFQALARLGEITPQQAELLYNDDPLFLSLERGTVTPAEFTEGVRHLLGKKIEDAAIIEAWNAMLLHFPPQNLALLLRLKRETRFRTFLLSNTNTIHIEEVYRRLKEASGEPNFGAFFDKVYLSQEIGARKPDPEAFQVILDEQGLDPEKTLFIDDTPKNLPGAEQLGIKTLLFPQNGNLPHIFEHGS